MLTRLFKPLLSKKVQLFSRCLLKKPSIPRTHPHLLSQQNFIPLHFLDTGIGAVIRNVNYNQALIIITIFRKYYTVIWVAHYCTTWERCCLKLGSPKAELETKFKSHDLSRCTLRRKRIKKAGNGRKERCGHSFVSGFSLIQQGNLGAWIAPKNWSFLEVKGLVFVPLG